MRDLIFLTLLMAMLLGIAGLACAVNLEDFEGTDLDSMWTVRDPGNKGEYRVEDGKLILDLAAGADMYKRGVDAGVMFLMDAPALDDYTIEMKVNVVSQSGVQDPACQIGPALFNEDAWAYTVWGPYGNTDIRVEDCIDQDYRWRDQTLIGVDKGDVDIDTDVWIKIVKTGTTLEFFAKADEDSKWISGGVDEKLGPQFVAGNYQVGILTKSWGGSINTVFEIEYFNIPEIAAVDAVGKLPTTWATIKK